MADGDPRHMRAALSLAARGLGRTRPNPAVGAVLVRHGAVIGKGWHRRAGLPHAEVEALAAAAGPVRGADLYVTLEPCGHTGRTPPCARAIIEAGVARVFYGCDDPNPLTAGKGLAMLRRAGVIVTRGPLENEARTFNAPYLKWITRGTPLVTAKWAMTLDGKIATRTGHSRWVTGPAARAIVHRLRGRVDAVLVGTGTVLADDPELTCRAPGGRTPVRVILDRTGRVPAGARVLRTASAGPVVVYTRRAAARSPHWGPTAARGVEIVPVPEARGGLSLPCILRDLGARGFQHLLVEGGAELLGRFFDLRLADRALVFLAPRIAGGAGAVTAVAGRGARTMHAALSAAVTRLRHAGPDVVLWADIAGGFNPDGC